GGENVDFKCTKLLEERVVMSPDDPLSNSSNWERSENGLWLVVAMGQGTTHQVS
ncbi:hypothetical protein HAX54_027095, partial [Datura stramonium]|nr:hypothetical protein [Datura stramonium]